MEERRESGVGQHVEVSLMASALAGLLNVGSGHVLADTDPGRQGNRHPSIAPYQPYRTGDGVLAIAAASPALWEKLCAALGRQDWRTDGRFGPINTVRQAFWDAEALGLEPVDVLDDGGSTGGRTEPFRSVRSPIRMSATPPSVRLRPPTNDQHGREIRAHLE